MSVWNWCLEKDDKTLATGWNQVGDYWYLFDVNGSMKTGWYEDTNGKYYYLSETTTDKFPQGAMVTGWIQLNSKWYYLYEATNESQGEYIGTTAYSCTKTIAEKEYSFDKDGVWIKNTNLLSDNGADFIGSWEGFWSKANYDPCYPGVENYITIGYGTTYEAMPSAFPNGIDSTCTVEQAREWLEKEAQTCAEIIRADLDSKNICLNKNQLDALISFAYNCGTGALLGSTLYKNIVAGVTDSDTITANFQAWSKANGVTSAGLLKRRNSEAALFLNADYSGNS
jgi:lysozyme